MNITQLEHLALFAVLTTCCLFNVPWWVIPIAAAFVIEFDQAKSYANPWWKWFERLDTKLDLIADFIGIGVAWLLWKCLQ